MASFASKFWFNPKFYLINTNEPRVQNWVRLGWPSGLKILVYSCLIGWVNYNLATLLSGFDDKYKSDEKTLSPWMGFLWHMDAEAIKKVAVHFNPGIFNPELYSRNFHHMHFNHELFNQELEISSVKISFHTVWPEPI